MGLLLYPDRLLRLRSEPVEVVTRDIQDFLDTMMDKMDEWGGIGLAAPQCGVNLRIFVMHLPGHKRLAFVNPKIEDLGEGISTMNEGCLSLPGALLEISRPSTIRLRALDYDGLPVDISCRGLASVCAQHENDHLDGILILDRVDPTERRLALQNVWDAEHPHH
jgi:peptide deformylase